MKLDIQNTFCPVCGYDLKSKIFNYEDDALYFSSEITGEGCPGCNCEFDYDLFPNEESYLKNRISWIKDGMKFGSTKLREKYPS